MRKWHICAIFVSFMAMGEAILGSYSELELAASMLEEHADRVATDFQ